MLKINDKFLQSKLLNIALFSGLAYLNSRMT